MAKIKKHIEPLQGLHKADIFKAFLEVNKNVADYSKFSSATWTFF
jgi:hypothetical protein